uniref:Uncharacterized protein n=1 Tax=Paramoeba aestuarina TaxID=180227 RepID=A0A7S4PE45_9EUKA
MVGRALECGGTYISDLSDPRVNFIYLEKGSLCASGVPYYLETSQKSTVKIFSSIRHLEESVKRKTLSSHYSEDVIVHPQLSSHSKTMKKKYCEELLEVSSLCETGFEGIKFSPDLIRTQ